MSVQADYARFFGRELATVRDQLLAYPDNSSVWVLPNGLPNSAGTLALHIAGNLRWFIGAQLGGSGYVRDRDAEFASRDVDRAELVRKIEAAADEVTRALATLDDASRLEDGGIEAVTMTHHQLHAGAFHRCLHAGTVVQGQGQRLFHQHVFAGRSRQTDMFGMAFMRCGDIHRIHAGIVAQRLHRGMNAAGKILNETIAGLLAWIAGGHQLQPGIGDKAGQHQGEGATEACNADAQSR